MNDATHRRKRLVVKIGSATLTTSESSIDYGFLNDLADQVARVRAAGWDVVIVTSAAIACGLEALGIAKRPGDMPSLQAAAAVGQSALSTAYAEAFAAPDMRTSVVLLTRRVTKDRSASLHARDTLTRLLELAERSYEVMRCKVDPEAWMADCLRAYALPEGTPAEQTLWGAYYLKARSDALESADAMLAQAEALCRADAALEQKCLPLLQKNRETVHALMAETTWDGCVEAGLPSFGVMRMPKDAENAEQVKTLRDEAKQLLKTVQSYFYAPSERVVDDLRRTLPALRGLLTLLRRFDERFTQEKRRRHLLDFSDLEHCMIGLLTKKGSGRPTEAAKSLAQSYREILIDEYQDSNAVQERIFQAVSRDGTNLF